MDIPSYQVQPEQTITLLPGALKQSLIKTTLEEKTDLPTWLKRQAAAGQITRLPTRAELADDINERLIIEYYSR
ncbi:MAG: hypothetical protein ACD_27C00047G0001 [uncultured bacterium]|nr:MAG: hypothetical protein ACD_27C00047G0001 [uncultured bacterium]